MSKHLVLKATKDGSKDVGWVKVTGVVISIAVMTGSLVALTCGTKLVILGPFLRIRQRLVCRLDLYKLCGIPSIIRVRMMPLGQLNNEHDGLASKYACFISLAGALLDTPKTS
jgi:hypothetical protein